MRRIKPRKLDDQAFKPYGGFAVMIDPEGIRFGEPPIEFFRDRLQLELGGKTTASFSVCVVRQRPWVVDKTEIHSSTGEGILPLDGDIIIHVGYATRSGTIPLDRLEAFRVPRGTMVVLRPGVWHHAPFCIDKEKVSTLIVLPERTYANDCQVFEIPPEDRTEIENAK